jgi:hypothetical protein
MAIAVGTINTDTCSGCSSITISHNTASGDNRLLLVGLAFDNDNLETVSSVTYNSVALTSQIQINNTDDAWAEIWTLVAPDTGTHDMVLTFSTSLLQQATVGVMSLTGVDQTTPVSATASDNTPATAASHTLNISSATDELVVDVLAGESLTSITADGSQTERWNLNNGFSYGGCSTKAGAASVDMIWSFGATDYWAHVAASLAPAVQGVPPIIHSYKVRRFNN